jgi:hypothetical protein
VSSPPATSKIAVRGALFPGDGDDADELLTNADALLGDYNSKGTFTWRCSWDAAKLLAEVHEAYLARTNT